MIKKEWVLISFIFLFLFSLTFVSAVTFSPYEKFERWNVYETGSEKVLYNAEIKGNDLIIKRNSFESSITRKECVANKITEVENCQDVKYDYTDTLRVKTGSKDIGAINVRDISDKGYSIPLDWKTSLFYKIGLESIIIIGDTSYNSTNTNATNQNGFAHLGINDSSVVLYMPFDVKEDNNKVTYDYSNNGNDGTLYGGVLWNETGGLNESGGYQFDRANIYGTRILLNEQPFSFSAWVNYNIQDLSDDSQTIFTPNWDYGNNLGYGWQIDDITGAEEKQKLYLGNNPIRSNSVIPANEWVHLVVVHNGTNVIFYMNGIEDGILSQSLRNDSLTSTYYRIGKESGSDEYRDFNGSIDEVMIFNRSLSATEIGQLYNQTYPLFYPTGKMSFNNNFSLENTNKAVITFQDCQTNGNSKLYGQINNGSITQFNSCSISNYTIEGNTSQATFNLFMEAGNLTNPFFTPIIIGNITINNYYENLRKYPCSNKSVMYDNPYLPHIRQCV